MFDPLWLPTSVWKCVCICCFTDIVNQLSVRSAVYINAGMDTGRVDPRIGSGRVEISEMHHVNFAVSDRNRNEKVSH